MPLICYATAIHTIIILNPKTFLFKVVMCLLLKFALFVLFNLLLGLLVALNSVKYITCGTLIVYMYYYIL